MQRTLDRLHFGSLKEPIFVSVSTKFGNHFCIFIRIQFSQTYPNDHMNSDDMNLS